MGMIAFLKRHWSLIDPMPVAMESYNFWRSVGYDHDGACAWLGNEQGEDGFDNSLHGDHGEATGPAQMHKLRIDYIRDQIGIDIMTASHLDQLKAIDWESRHAPGVRHTYDHMMAAQGIRAKVTILVSEYEKSKLQGRDIDRRTLYAGAWAAKIPPSPAPGPAP